MLQNYKNELGKNGKLLIIGGIESEAQANGILTQGLLCSGNERALEEYKVILQDLGLKILLITKSVFGHQVMECELF